MMPSSGHAFARAHHDDGTDPDLVGIDRFDLSIAFNIGLFRADIHHLGDGVARFVDRIVFEEIAYLVEQHDSNRFGEFRQAERADGSDAHEEILVEDVARRDVTGRFLENGPAEHQVGNEEDNKREERIGKCCLKAVESRRCERNDDDRSYEKRGTDAYA